VVWDNSQTRRSSITDDTGGLVLRWHESTAWDDTGKTNGRPVCAATGPGRHRHHSHCQATGDGLFL